MKIATWNVERLKHGQLLGEMLQACENICADILVLTETDRRLRPNFHYSCETPQMSEFDPLYAKNENRVSIFSNYPIISQYPTYDDRTALCVEVDTEYGNLIVYGTIIGIYGNRHVSFLPDLQKQIADIRCLSHMGKPICICGDFNCSFADNYYFTTAGRKRLLDLFKEEKITLLTSQQKECIDHIAISTSWVDDDSYSVKEWNEAKKLSDHKGIAVTINRGHNEGVL